ncbi:hypothetical protein Ddye_032227 [Dipteronia dyeriana]|uniref:Uncharacterized protein n=1 Tax=Dipteronia dyeriana TaxID=168575 RepID=A0AAD9TL06_9ROSI|nr:hypothetical protein Ddye_032227 [Dipteronia dyeriana]
MPTAVMARQRMGSGPSGKNVESSVGMVVMIVFLCYEVGLFDFVFDEASNNVRRLVKHLISGIDLFGKPRLGFGGFWFWSGFDLRVVVWMWELEWILISGDDYVGFDELMKQYKTKWGLRRERIASMAGSVKSMAVITGECKGNALRWSWQTIELHLNSDESTADESVM